MNKQNKLAAQEERAAKRAKAERREKASYIFKFWAPIVGVVVVAVVLIWAVATSGSSSSSSDDTDTDSIVTTESTESTAVTETDSTEAVTESTTEETTESATLNTDTSLVAEDGQTVNIDFTGYIDGELFDGGSTDGAGYDLELGSDSFIDGFEDGIVGHNVGDTFTLDLQFPDDYWSSDYAGKDVSFEVTLNGIYE